MEQIKLDTVRDAAMARDYPEDAQVTLPVMMLLGLLAGCELLVAIQEQIGRPPGALGVIRLDEMLHVGYRAVQHFDDAVFRLVPTPAEAALTWIILPREEAEVAAEVLAEHLIDGGSIHVMLGSVER